MYNLPLSFNFFQYSKAFPCLRIEYFFASAKNKEIISIGDFINCTLVQHNPSVI